MEFSEQRKQLRIKHEFPRNRLQSIGLPSVGQTMAGELIWKNK